MQRQVISLVQDPSYGVTSSHTSDCRTPHKRRLSGFHWGRSDFTFDLGLPSSFIKNQGTQSHLPAVQISLCSFLYRQGLMVLLTGRFTLMMARACLQPRIGRSKSSLRVEDMVEKFGLSARGRMCLNRNYRRWLFWSTMSMASRGRVLVSQRCGLEVKSGSRGPGMGSSESWW
jgi:hypothetical protein